MRMMLSCFASREPSFGESIRTVNFAAPVRSRFKVTAAVPIPTPSLRETPDTNMLPATPWSSLISTFNTPSPVVSASDGPTCSMRTKAVSPAFEIPFARRDERMSASIPRTTMRYSPMLETTVSLSISSNVPAYTPAFSGAVSVKSNVASPTGMSIASKRISSTAFSEKSIGYKRRRGVSVRTFLDVFSVSPVIVKDPFGSTFGPDNASTLFSSNSGSVIEAP